MRSSSGQVFLKQAPACVLKGVFGLHYAFRAGAEYEGNRDGFIGKKHLHGRPGGYTGFDRRNRGRFKLSQGKKGRTACHAR